MYGPLHYCQLANEKKAALAPESTPSSDALNLGRGCACTDSQPGGEWLPEESSFHINYLELKAAHFALKCFQREVVGKHVRIMNGSTSAVVCINHMGTSHSESCNSQLSGALSPVNHRGLHKS